jgi:hypothetical protein
LVPRLGLHLLNDVFAVRNFAKDHMLAIQVRGFYKRDEKLGPVRIGASVSHAQQIWLGVLVDEILVLKLLSVDGLATGSL